MTSSPTQRRVRAVEKISGDNTGPLLITAAATSFVGWGLDNDSIVYGSFVIAACAIVAAITYLVTHIWAAGFDDTRPAPEPAAPSAVPSSQGGDR